MSFLKNIWRSNSKHKKLYEEWALTNIINKDSMVEESLDSSSFIVKYLGSHTVSSGAAGGGEAAATSEAIKTILRTARTGSKRPQRVAVCVSQRGITVTDVLTGEELMDVSIYSISHCSADASHQRVFSFIAASSPLPPASSGTTKPTFKINHDDDIKLECHAFLCSKRRVTHALTLTLAQAFNAAYEAWRKHERKLGLLYDAEDASCSKKPPRSPLLKTPRPVTEKAPFYLRDENYSEKAALIDIDGENDRLNKPWVCFDDNDELFNNKNQPKHPWAEKQPLDLLCS